MKKKSRIFISQVSLLGFFLTITFSCEKDVTIKDPLITWTNPVDIVHGTLLSAAQLNATADVPGNFVYTPPIGTKLPEGANQDLSVDFTPADELAYNKASKTVKITVLPDGVSNVLFNSTLTYGTVIDNDGNICKTITIGTQTWMAENLRSTKYRNGDTIPEVTGNTTWKNLTTDACCSYENTTEKNKIATMGRLYNWFAVTDSRNIAPIGWHVATDAEWDTLTTYLGSNAGGKIKETGNTHWNSPNTGATNSSGFTALPAGRREYTDGSFINNGYNGFWWTSSAYNPDYSWYRFINYNDTEIIRANFHKQYGFSVRCVKD